MLGPKSKQPRSSIASRSRFYRGLFAMDRHTNPAAVLDDALQFLVEASEAAFVHVELFVEHGERFACSHCAGVDPEMDVRARISTSIVAHAMSDASTVEVAAAVLDEQFRDAVSVRRNNIHAVLCVPIADGRDAIVGVVYLQGGSGGGPFSAFVRERVEALAQAVAGIANRLRCGGTLTYARLTSEYASSVVNDALVRNGWNLSAAARELRIDRKTLYNSRALPKRAVEETPQSSARRPRRARRRLPGDTDSR